MKLLLSLLLASGAFAQEAEKPHVPLPPFTEGLYTRYSANAIPDGALSEALNVLIDEDVDGVVVARSGYVKYNTTALANTLKVRGLWTFDAADGNKYLVAHTSSSFYSSTGDGAWSAITGLNSFSLTKDFDCVQTIGKLYCANGDVTISWDGSSTAAVSGAPIGNLVGRFRNRLLIAGIAGSKARLRGSGELDGTDWTVQTPGVSTTPFNIAFGGADDGEDITCLMGAYHDVFLVGKRNSLWGLYGFGRNDFQVREISREVGCVEQRSVKEKNNCLYWMSLRGVERFCGSAIERISDPIRDKIDVIIAAAGNARSHTDTTQGDFEGGNLTASGPGAPISATISAGSIVPTTWSIVDTSSTDFAAATFSVNVTTDVVGRIQLSSSVFQDNFSDGVVFSGNAPIWTAQVAQGDWSVPVDDVMGARVLKNDGGGSEIEVNQSVSTGSFQWRFRHMTDSVVNRFYFLLNGNNTASSEGYVLEAADSTSGSPETITFQLKRNPAGTVVLSTAIVRGGESTVHHIEIQRSTAGVFSLFYSTSGFSSFVFTSSGTDNTYNTSTRMILLGTAANSLRVTDLYFVKLSTYAIDRSRIFDVGLTTPIAGPFSSTHTLNSGTVSYFVRSSTSPNDDMWTAFSAAFDTLRPSFSYRYVQYEARLAPLYSGSSVYPYIDDIGLSAATSGYFISDCATTTGMTSWETMSCNQDLNDGTITLFISTGATCAAANGAAAVWYSQTNNAEITVGTGPFAAYRVLFQIDSATETPRIRDCTISWREGDARPPVASMIYRDRYYMAYTSNTALGSVNDHILVLDKNDKWTLFNAHNCYSLANYERKLYCGASTASGQVWKLDTGTDDDGTAILSRIRTKAYHLGMPERRKMFDRLYLDLEPSPEATQTITLTGRYLLERSTPTYSLGNVDLNEDPGSIMTSRFPFPLTNPVTGRYIQLELESSGLNSPWKLFSGRLYYSPMGPE